MAASILDGKEIAREMREALKAETASLKEQGVVPGLGVVLVGNDPASVSYVTAKEKACGEAGILSKEIRLPETATEEELLEVLGQMNGDPQIHGILLQLPLPRHFDERKMIMQILPEKDVDGFHPVNVGKMVLGQDTFFPCTPFGIVKLLSRSGRTVSGSHVVIVGRSNIVGKPLANMLVQKGKEGNATVTVCHTGTPDLSRFTLQADILIAAAGRPELITADMVKEGTVVIDVGVNRVEDASKKRGYRLVGDVAFDEVKEKASFITPVPGGVGPMTITMLLYNTVKSAKLHHGIRS